MNELTSRLMTLMGYAVTNESSADQHDNQEELWELLDQMMETDRLELRQMDGTMMRLLIVVAEGLGHEEAEAFLEQLSA